MSDGALHGKAVPTLRAVGWALAGLLPLSLATAIPALLGGVLAWNAALLLLVAVDFLRAPRRGALTARRLVEPVLSAGRANPVTVELELAPGARAAVRGTLRDWVAPGPDVDGNVQRFALTGHLALRWHVTPKTRGTLDFGDLHLRLDGPWGLCARQVVVPAAQAVRVYPDLIALTKDALFLAQATPIAAKRAAKALADGREFDRLRDYQPGDSPRTVDWKASARRGKPMVRAYRAEQHQQVIVLLDCGRHMAGEVRGRRKLDWAVDAALRLAKVALDEGDLVGVQAFSSDVLAWLPPQRGAAHLRSVTHALAHVEATLTEPQYDLAFERAFRRASKRSLVVVLTDLLDPDAGQRLIRRMGKLRPKHLPLLASLVDEDVQRLALASPQTDLDAHRRLAAERLERDVTGTVRLLEGGGTLVVRTRAEALGPAMVQRYLEAKAKNEL